MPKLPASLMENLPALLKSRPERQIIDKKRHENVVFNSDAGQVLPYFLTGCDTCSFDYRQIAKIAQIAVEDCEALELHLCFVVASIELIKSEKIKLHVSQARGTISVDMSADISIQFEDPNQGEDLIIYTSSCTAINLLVHGNVVYKCPDSVMKPGRYKTWRTKGESWRSARCNLYGDVLPDDVTDSYE